MLPNSEDFTRPMSEDTERHISDDSANIEALRLERSREYRRRYKERQKDKDKQLQNQMKETELEMERLRLEQAALISQSHALSSLCSYSNNMLDALTKAASASAAKARSLGGRALEGVITFRGWAKHQWLMVPTATELLSGTVWRPSDDYMRIAIKFYKPEDFVSRHVRFLDRLEQLLEEGEKYPESRNVLEVKINHIISVWTRFIILIARERREVMEEIACKYTIKTLREQAAAGSYVRPRILQDGSDELARCVALSSEQRSKLEGYWKQFLSDIEKAMSALGQQTFKVADAVEAVMETGEYKPTSSADAAKCFLLATDAANASDEFLAREGRAFINLWIATLQLLTPMQTAVVLTSCRPLMPHLPDVCITLLNSNDTSISAVKSHNLLI